MYWTWTFDWNRGKRMVEFEVRICQVSSKSIEPSVLPAPSIQKSLEYHS
jgi:hypothetical protein